MVSQCQVDYLICQNSMDFQPLKAMCKIRLRRSRSFGAGLADLRTRKPFVNNTDNGENRMTAGTKASQSVWQRWGRIAHSARKARAHRGLFIASAVIAILYNVIGAVDVMTTIAGIQGQVATESNPFLRLLMNTVNNGWVLTKLGLQLLVSAMILWFPHRMVLGMFTVAMILTGVTVWNNLQIIGAL